MCLKITVDAWMPTDATAILTVIDAKVVRSGRNLPKLERFQKDFVITKSSKYNTSQITTFTIQTGVISNSGELGLYHDAITLLTCAFFSHDIRLFTVFPSILSVHPVCLYYVCQPACPSCLSVYLYVCLMLVTPLRPFISRTC